MLTNNFYFCKIIIYQPVRNMYVNTYGWNLTLLLHGKDDKLKYPWGREYLKHCLMRINGKGYLERKDHSIQ